MPELTDDQLDGLFRKSAEEFDPPFDPAAWRDMKTRLDANDRNPSGGSLIWKNLLRWGLPLVLLLLVSGGGWYAYRRVHPAVVNIRSRVMPTAGGIVSQKSKQTRSGVMSPASDHESARTTTVGPNESEAHAAKQPTDRVASVADPARSGQRLDKSVTNSESNVVPNPKAATKRPALTYRPETERTRLNDVRSAEAVDTGSKNVLKTAPSREGSTVSRIAGATKRQRKPKVIRLGETSVAMNATGSALRSTKRKRSADYREIEKSTKAKAEGIPGNLTSPGVFESNTNPVAFPALSELTVRPAKWPKPLSFTGREITSQPDTTARKIVANRDPERGLSIRALAAPDLSSIGLKNFSRPGTNIGLLLEYRIASRWSVQAGVIQSTKLYRAVPDGYTAPAGEWGGPIKPLSVDGRCNMLDIPINLRYDVFLQPQADGRLASRWFISGGVTSYIMEQEDYNYNYPYVPHNYQPIKNSVSTGGYGFSNLNLSLGYERAFSRRLSWQVEPFVKVPLKGIGYFKSNLISTGAFFSIRYKLSK